MRLCISGWRRWGGVFDIPGKRGQVAALQKKTESPDFWNDPKAAEVFMKNLNGVKSWVTGFDKASTEVDDLDVLYDFAKESLGGSTDETVTTAETQELDESYSKAVEDVEALELRNMLGAEGDNLGAVLTINSGAGGTEANDWSSMLVSGQVTWHALLVRKRRAKSGSCAVFILLQKQKGWGWSTKWCPSKTLKTKWYHGQRP